MSNQGNGIDRIVIVGAGVSAAEELRKLDQRVDITIVGAGAHLPYDRPPLSKEVMLGKKQLAETSLHPEEWYADNHLTLLRGQSVTAIDLAAKQVRTASASLGYDRLLLATGSTARHLPMADDSGADVRHLRTRDDAEALTSRLTGRLLIIGGGWIGLELAAAARTAGGSVVIVEAAALPLGGVLGPEVADVFLRMHRDHGVDVRTSTTVLEIRHDATGTTARLSDGTDITVDTIVVGVGATPNTELAEAAGLVCSNGVEVDARLRTSDPSVFAAGDVANHLHPTLGRLRVEHWDNAMAQGRHAAHALLGDEAPYTAQPYFFTDQYDLGMEYVGHADAHDQVHLRGDLEARVFRAFWSREGRIVAGMHCNDWDAIQQIRDVVGGPVDALPG